jgi:hypothetical protein
VQKNRVRADASAFKALASTPDDPNDTNVQIELVYFTGKNK